MHNGTVVSSQSAVISSGILWSSKHFSFVLCHGFVLLLHFLCNWRHTVGSINLSKFIVTHLAP